MDIALDVSVKDCAPDDMGKNDYKVYKRRWVMLILFVFYSASNAMQWIQYSIISNIISKFYGISSTWVDWTSMIYMILYVPLIFPGSWFLDKMGLRITTIVGILGTCIGSWIKVFSVQPDLFFVSFLGQSIVAASQVFVLSLPARLAAVWFGSNQMSSACSIGVFGNQLGVALGFVLPTILVRNSNIKEEVRADLQWMFAYVAIFTSILAFLIIIFFQDKPPTAPSMAQELSSENFKSSGNFTNSLRSIVLNKNYILLLLSYGINVGVFYAISTLLNPVVLFYFPGHEVDTGRIGLCIVLSGMIGSVISGLILDKTHKFKETTFVIYGFSMLAMWLFTFTLNSGNISVIYVTASLLGFFMTGYLPVGFEFSAELTYPEPEGTTCGLINAASQVFGIAFTNVYSVLLREFGDIFANIVMALMLVIGLILTSLIHPHLRRQNALANK